MISLAFSTAASALKTEQDPKTGREIRSAVTVLASGRGMQLNFFVRGGEKLIEFVEGGALEGYPMKLLKTMAIHLKLKNDSLPFPAGYHEVYGAGRSWLAPLITGSGGTGSAINPLAD